MSELLLRLQGRLARYRTIFFSRSVDESTAEGRAAARLRRVAWSALASACAKMVSVSTSLISVPLTLGYLGHERYGMWMAISSLIAILSFADFGIGNGILSEVAKAKGQENTHEIRRIVTNGYVLLTSLFLVAIALLGSFYSHIAWASLFNVQTPQAVLEAGPATATLIAIFAASMPLSIVARLQAGLQQGFMVSVWQCIGSMLALACTLYAIHAKLSLPWLVASMAGVPAVSSLMNTLYFFIFARPDLAPKPHLTAPSTMRQIAGKGGMFFLLQLVMAVLYASDNFLIARLLGPLYVTEFSVPEKLFSLISISFAMILAPLWPAYSEALARGDQSWIQQVLKRSLLSTFALVAPCALALVFLAPKILDWWVDAKINPPLMLLCGFAFWKIVEVCGMTLATYLNGLHQLRFQVVIAIVTAVIAVTLKIYVIKLWGIAGIPWVMASTYILFALIPFLIFIFIFKPGMNPENG